MKHNNENDLFFMCGPELNDPRTGTGPGPGGWGDFYVNVIFVQPGKTSN